MTNRPTISFNRPTINPAARRHLTAAVASGKHSGAGPFTAACQTLLQDALGVGKVLLTTSGTHALEFAALLTDVGPGDEVIVPAFTFVSTVNAFVLRGATPRFIDIDPDTLNLDAGQLPDLICPQTRAVVPVHYAGVGCDMDAIGAESNKHDLWVIEDNAHGLFGRYRNRPLGTFGRLAIQSFHETKNISCGEGGALLINDARLIERAEILWEKGTDRSRFFRGQVDRYTWVDVGSSFVLSDLLAAILLGQLEHRHEIQTSRAAVWARYQDGLKGWAKAAGVRLPVIPTDREQPSHMFYLLLPSLEARTRFCQAMRTAGIEAPFHYQPLHLSAMGRRFGGREGMCPVTEDVSDRLVRLPLYSDLGVEDQSRVIEEVTRFSP